jgi:hypothetical protein
MPALIAAATGRLAALLRQGILVRASWSAAMPGKHTIAKEILMSDKQGTPAWFLWMLERPFWSMLALIVIVVGIPSLLAVYLDRRIADLDTSLVEGRPRNEPTAAVPAELPQAIVTGQTVYVPVYSHIYQGKGTRLMLAGTLSIRNTDMDHSITISRVQYYDTAGKMVRDYLKSPLKLGAMSSTDFFVSEEDDTGGPGANFLVEWVSEIPVRTPIIECVMVGRNGGSAFVRTGEVIEQHGEEK